MTIDNTVEEGSVTKRNEQERLTMELNQCRRKNNRIAELRVVCGSSAILHFAGRQLPAAIGSSGLRIDKREGDGGTPVGCLPLRRVLYRSDRLDAPSHSIPCQPLTEADGWCDDENHTDYNRQIHLPHPARHEKLWLDNEIYDSIGVLGL